MALLAAWFYFWTVAQPPLAHPYMTRDPQGYYAFQAAGYRTGHLYLALKPNPALLALSDPYDPVANAPYRVHDLSLFGGHYYMYFGATPAVLLFWPVAVLTGSYPTDQFAVALFCTGAVWTGIALLLTIRRRLFPDAPSWLLIAGAVCLAFVTPLTSLAEAPQFYQVPISCAVFLQALMLAAGYKSMVSSRRSAWLAAAGLALGLSLGARPNYLLGAFALLVPILDAVRRRPAGVSQAKAFLTYSSWAYLPTFVCGVALLAYNHARFGKFGEFGMHFQLAGERVTNLKAISAWFILPHYWDYLLGHGVWQSYFPFFTNVSGAPFGIVRYLPWTLLTAFAFMRPKQSSDEEETARKNVALLVGVAALANLTLLSSFFGTTPRYPADFAQATLLLSGIGGLAAWDWSREEGRRRLIAAASVVLACVSLVFSAAVYLSSFPAPGELAPLARIANRPFYQWQKFRHQELGGIRLTVELPAVHPDMPEPLLETGRQPDQRDWLQIEYLSDTTARLGFFHAGTGVFESQEFEIPQDRVLVVELQAGSLLPPFTYPVFSGWSPDEYAIARRNLQVSVNGASVMDLAIDCYESSPADLRIGKMEWNSGGMAKSFSGEVRAVERLPLVRPAKEVPQFATAAPIEITVQMPSGKTGGADPILVSGAGDKSDLVYCIYQGGDHVKFAFDHFGNGGLQSESVHYDPQVPHRIVILNEAVAGSSLGRLAILFDDRLMMNITQHFYPTTPQTEMVGYNKFNSSGAGRQFTGKILGMRQVGTDVIPPLAPSGLFGGVDMSVIFPLNVPGTNEPLVVTGAAGAGDFIYVRYLDANHISLGFDHWAVGGVVSPPIELNYGEAHHLSVTMGSLYPEGCPARESRLLKVSLDGEPVLQGAKDTYLSAAAAIDVAANRIGGSTCGPAFTGRILALERLPWSKK